MRGGLFDRLDVRPLLLDHARSLRKVGSGKPDYGARILLFGVPIVMGVISYFLKWRLTDPGSLLAASGLLAGILFAAFTHLAALRERMESKPAFVVDEIARKHFRETAAHLMAGSLAAAVESLILVAASGMRPTPDAKVDRISSALVIGLGAYLFLVFVVSVRRMYSAYIRAFEGGWYLRKRDKSNSNSAAISSDRSGG